MTDTRLADVVLDETMLSSLSPLLEADRTQAVADLAADNHFAVLPGKLDASVQGPFVLHLSLWEGKLVFDVRHHDGTELVAFGLALGPFRGLVKDYGLIVDSHAKAVAEGREARIQAIDMGRRGLHDEGAKLLMQRLDGKIEIDLATARRLFTLICVLLQRS